MDKLNPKALAPCGDNDLDAREGVQGVEEFMIQWYVIESSELPAESAEPFAVYLNQNWNDYNDEGNLTNGEVIAGALAFWRGQ